jgi:hypothetical protein
MAKSRFETPQAFKQSLEQRLRDKTASSGADISRLRQVLIYERFLARVFEVFGNDAILKGGIVLELRLERARSTKDVDLGLRGNPQTILERLQEAGQLALGDFLTFEITNDAKQPDIIAEGLSYEGFRFRAQCYLAGQVYGSRYGVDVVVAERAYKPAELLEGSSFLSFAEIPAPRLRVYAVESHLAEKFHAYTLPRPRPNSRVKDLPDLALLGTIRQLRAEELLAALKWTFELRKTHPLPKSVPLPPAEWAPIYSRMAATNYLRWSTLEDVYAAAREFIEPVLGKERGTWDPQSWVWRPSM